MMTWLALRVIRFYQVAISPYKGFRCAYAYHTGRCGCSALGFRAIRRFGVWHGMQVLDGRLHKCGVAFRRYKEPTRFGGLRRQAGDCDCGGCDLPDSSDCRVGKTILDCACNASSCDCDWKKRRSNNDREVTLPPRRSRSNRSSG